VTSEKSSLACSFTSAVQAVPSEFRNPVRSREVIGSAPHPALPPSKKGMSACMLFQRGIHRVPWSNS
uniref:Uncharacterized protein n=1 Tax=Anopheles albimanus TaxID=7167 RepID=A0A182FXP0_ANOAL